MQSKQENSKLSSCSYAQVIVDITSGNLDKSFQYRIPEHLLGRIRPGTSVVIPFGRANRLIQGYVVDLEELPACDLDKLKDIHEVNEGNVAIENQLISLAYWMKQQYGSAMISCLKTVIPVTKTARPVVKREIIRTCSDEVLEHFLDECTRKKQKARIRLLEALQSGSVIPYELATQKLHITATVIKSLSEKGILEVREKAVLRSTTSKFQIRERDFDLNPTQCHAVSELLDEINKPMDQRRPCLLYGITGSGKTEVYMELIQDTLEKGKQAIVLIPEIALTYQTVMRFYEKFGDRVSFIHSRLSPAERYDQYLKATEGLIDVMIGPRSAIFTPFMRLGLMILDEEHEAAYKSETVPRYHARDVAIARAGLCDAAVVLGSATPSVESAYYASTGTYRLVTMNTRAHAKAVLPGVKVVDMRKELRMGNKTMFSRYLYEQVKNRLDKKEQVMLFLNRRGYENFMSCRSCGEPLKCPHCDVSLTLHRNGRLHCHYCGYITNPVKQCPACGSPYIAGFGMGTEKVEEKLQELFPEARILRMDLDTTKGKDGHEKILSAFANEEADILVGTQMIVKGHDFKKVTLVSALAADTSLFASDFRACERTFQLLTQAAGRAGRNEIPGEMVIQTYKPEQYSIVTAAAQDYDAYFKEEISYRRIMNYPPYSCMCEVIFSGRSSKDVLYSAQISANGLRNLRIREMQVLGPSQPHIGKINDIYYYHLFIRTRTRGMMNETISWLQKQMKDNDLYKNCLVQFDLL